MTKETEDQQKVCITQLITAVKNSDFATVILILNNEPLLINGPHFLLLWAVRENNKEMVSLLLKAKADIDQKIYIPFTGKEMSAYTYATPEMKDLLDQHRSQQFSEHLDNVNAQWQTKNQNSISLSPFEQSIDYTFNATDTDVKLDDVRTQCQDKIQDTIFPIVQDQMFFSQETAELMGYIFD